MSAKIILVINSRRALIYFGFLLQRDRLDHNGLNVGSTWSPRLNVNFLENMIGQFTYFGSSIGDRLGVIAGKWENIG